MVTRIKEGIMKAMNQLHGGVSFVDIERQLTCDGIEFEGDYVMCVPSNENVILWGHISFEFSRAMEELIFIDQKILPVPASPLVYLMDGKCLQMPIAKDLKYKYLTDRWFPVVFRKGSLDEEAQRLH